MVSKIRTSNKADWVLESITVIAHHCPLTEIDRYLDMKRMLIVPLLAVASMATAQDEPPVDLYPRVQVQTTVGSFVVELDARRAPFSVKNFVQYVNNGFYEGTIFHRVIDGFVAQGGGFTTEFEVKPPLDSIPNESGNGLQNRRGAIAMARTNDPHSADSQFYINLADNSALDPKPARWGYAVFGEVVEGMEVVDAIARVPTGPAGPFDRDAPQTSIVIERAVVLKSTLTDEQ